MAGTHSRMTSRGRWLIIGLIGLMTSAILTACKPALNADAEQGSFTVGSITTDGADRYLYEDRRTGLTVRAPTSNEGGGKRVAVVKTDSPVLVDQQSCINWNGPSGWMIQPGVVLRTKVEPDRTRAVLVTNNIYFGFRQGFNVHMVDTNGLNEEGTGPGSFTHPRVASFDLHEGVGTINDGKPLPWRICARVVDRVITVKAWSVPSFSGEPSWADPVYAKSAVLPQTSVYAGQPGVYFGHLKAGEHTHVNRLVTGSPTAPPPTTTTTGPTTTALPATTTTTPPTTVAPTTVAPTTTNPAPVAAAPPAAPTPAASSTTTVPTEVTFPG